MHHNLQLEREPLECIYRETLLSSSSSAFHRLEERRVKNSIETSEKKLARKTAVMLRSTASALRQCAPIASGSASSAVSTSRRAAAAAASSQALRSKPTSLYRSFASSSRAMSSQENKLAASSLVPAPQPLPLQPPSIEQEEAAFEQACKDVQAWFDSPRFKGIKRPYGPADVVSKRGSMPVQPPQSSFMADKLFSLLSKHAEAGTPCHTMGAIDPVQVTQMAYHQEVVYVSGWASSSVLTTCSNEVGPDLADYPYTTVPNQVQRLFKAQLHHDRKHFDERVNLVKEQRAQKPWVDYLRPIIADADTGHGGLSTVLKLAKLFAENGAAAIHFEDQLHGGKKVSSLGFS